MKKISLVLVLVLAVGMILYQGGHLRLPRLRV